MPKPPHPQPSADGPPASGPAGRLAFASLLVLTLPVLRLPAARAEPGPARAVVQPASRLAASASPRPAASAPSRPAAPAPSRLAAPAPLQPKAPLPAPAPPSAGPIGTPSSPVAHPDKVLVEAVALAGRRLVAGGLNGLLILSDDDGATWRQVQLPVSVTLTAIRFVDAQTGWAVGHFGAVLRSTDAGEHWSLVTDNDRAVRITLDAARGANAADAVRDRAVQAAQALAQTDPSRPFLLIQTDGLDTVRLIGADGLSIGSLDGGQHWLPWSAGIENPDRLPLHGLADRAGIVVAAGARGVLLAGKPAEGLRARKSPYGGTFFGVLDGGRVGFVLFGQQGHVFASTDPVGDPAAKAPSWRQIDDPSPTALTAGLLRQDGSVLLGDASGATWRVEGKPDDLRLVPEGPQASFPILALAEAPDRSLILAGSGGVIRVPPEPRADSTAAR